MTRQTRVINNKFISQHYKGLYIPLSKSEIDSEVGYRRIWKYGEVVFKSCLLKKYLI